MDPTIVQEPIVVDVEESLSKAFGLLSRRKDDYFFVTKNNAYVGVVDSRTLRDFFGNPSETKAKSVMTHAPALRLQDSDEEVVRKLMSTRTKALPVVDKRDRIVGAVTRWNALALVKASPLVHGKKVAEAMSSPAITIPEESTIAQARHAMKEHGIFRLIVTNKDGLACGMVSAFDIATKAHPSAKEKRRQYYYFPTPKLRMDEEPVKMIMSETLLFVKPSDSVLEATQKFEQHGISSVAVVEDGKAKGVLTLRDVYDLCLVPEQANVRIEGLGEEERVFKASLQTLATRYWEKITHRQELQPDDSLTIHIKTKNIAGNRREYEVKSRLTVRGNVLASHPKDKPEHYKNWDLQAAVKESLEDLLKMAEHDKH